jgi:hypothetical protein
MKKTLFLAFATLFTFVAASVQAQELFYLTREGAVAEYETKDSLGLVTSYTQITITDVAITDARNHTISHTTQTFDNKHKPSGKPSSEPTVVRDGVVQMPSKVEGRKITWTRMPSHKADLSIGKEFISEFSMRVMMIKTTMTVKGKVIARETITTPAGSFDCYKIETNTKLTAMGESGDMMKAVSWVSAGIGDVKTETYGPEGKLMMTQELISLK